MPVKFDVRAYKYQLTLPGNLQVDYEAPYAFYLPRALRDMHLNGYEPLTMGAFLACLERSGSGAAFDIGANIGLYAMLAATAGKECVAFEPMPDPGMVLEDIAERYALPITVRRVAMADEVGRREFYLSTNSDMSNSLNPHFRQHVGVLDVETSTIDIEARKVRPSVIKIDTETTEMEVLRGGLATLTEMRPYVLLELLTADANTGARDFFSSLGYSLYPLGEAVTWTGIDIPPVVEGDRRNYLASPVELDRTFFEKAAGFVDMLAKLPKPL